ncbi:uncharacterized protein LOC118437479 [Folsomia candida]|uniref:uncharacterized protein LOC118437479 n=1 Tax=Folsomia candida TaxID=158441 RepID=UPI0016053ED5|nr:uncharacterized protein LOC118437479 [Folsomia candida]
MLQQEVTVLSAAILHSIYLQLYAPRNGVNILFTVQQIIFLNGALIAAGIAVYLQVYGNQGVLVYNALIDVYDEVEEYEYGTISKESNGVIHTNRNTGLKNIFAPLFDRKTPIWKTRDGQIDKRGTIMAIVLLPLPLYTYIFAPIVVLVNDLDVPKYLFEDIWAALGLQGNSIVCILNKIIRTGMAFAAFAELFRTFPNFIFTMVIPEQIMVRTTKFFISHSSTLDYGKLADLLRIFTQLKIILQTGEKPLANAIFPLMTGGLILSSSLNFAAIRFYGIFEDSD